MTWSVGAGLEGKGVIVTGAAGGIGKAVAQAFSTTGAKVMAVDLDQAQDRRGRGRARGQRATSAWPRTWATWQATRRSSPGPARSSATSTCWPTSPRCCVAAAAWTR